MEKILALLEQMGIKPELATEFTTLVENFVSTQSQKLKEDYDTRIAAAKKVCIDETNAHKTELSRRLQIFCEAKSALIEQHLTKQAGAREGEATVKLEQIYKMLEGITDDTATKARMEALETKMAKITEERDAAIRKANKQNAVAERVLQRNRVLERQIQEGSDRGQPARRQPVTEGRQPAPTRGSIDARLGGNPVTTRRTIKENNNMRQPTPQPRQVVTTGGNKAPSTPAEIAETITDGEE